MDFYRWVKTQWDRSAAVLAFVIGLVALFLGWRGVSYATVPTEQIPYLVSGGLFGLFALATAGILWLSADLRDEWRKLDDINKQLAAGAAEVTAELPGVGQALADDNGFAGTGQ